MKTVTPLAEQARGVPVELGQHVSSILVTDVEDAPSPPTQTNCCRFHVFLGGGGWGLELAKYWVGTIQWDALHMISVKIEETFMGKIEDTFMGKIIQEGKN